MGYQKKVQKTALGLLAVSLGACQPYYGTALKGINRDSTGTDSSTLVSLKSEPIAASEAASAIKVQDPQFKPKSVYIKASDAEKVALFDKNMDEKIKQIAQFDEDFLSAKKDFEQSFSFYYEESQWVENESAILIHSATSADKRVLKEDENLLRDYIKIDLSGGLKSGKKNKIQIAKNYQEQLRKLLKEQMQMYPKTSALMVAAQQGYFNPLGNEEESAFVLKIIAAQVQLLQIWCDQKNEQ